MRPVNHYIYRALTHINIWLNKRGWDIGMADFSQVTDRLFTGAAIEAHNDVVALTNAGITHIIDCRDDFDDGCLLADHPGVTYLHNGTADDGQPKSPEWFGKSIQFALSALARPNNKVYAHCAAGINRGPSTCYAIMLALGFTPEDAERIMREARPQIGLAYKKDAELAVKVLGYV